MVSWRFVLVFLTIAPYILHVNCDNCNCCDSCKFRKHDVLILIESGWVRGRIRDAEDGSKYASFRGVPYGMPPIGERRFKELEPVEPWGYFEVFDALEDGYACPQNDFIYGRFKCEPKGQSEDCIYLNLHVPYEAVPKQPPIWCDTVQKGLPILVFIHEGAFQSGSGLTDVCGPEFLLTRKIIVITFNFRLNVFGFLSLNSREIPGNQGLRDMVTLLHWVQRNARSFGGDPDNVTLMGHSGGGTSAHLLSLSKAARGLFHRVIAMSCNAFPAYYTASPEYAKHVSQMLLKELGINETCPKKIHKKLTKVPLIKLMDANTMVQHKTGFVSFAPVEESPFPGITRVIDLNPTTLIAMGRATNYPTLFSFTSNEMDFCKGLLLRKGLLQQLEKDPTSVLSMRLLYSLSKAEIEKIGDLVHERYFESCPKLESIMKYYTDMYFKHPAFKVAEWRAALGGAPVYMFQFAYEAKDSIVKTGFWTDYKGAAHFEDFLNIFRANSLLAGKVFYPPRNDDDYMKFYMVDIVVNFMNCDNPTCECGRGNSSWLPVSTGKLQYNLITNPYTIQMRTPTRNERDVVNFFDSFDPEVRKISHLVANREKHDLLIDEQYLEYYNSDSRDWK